jgi:hypothetical protein
MKRAFAREAATSADQCRTAGADAGGSVHGQISAFPAWHDQVADGYSPITPHERSRSCGRRYACASVRAVVSDSI